MTLTPNRRMAFVAVVTLVLDQLSKLAVLNFLGYAQERVVIEGFFKFVHWGNTGAAWSMFHNNNELLTIVAMVALLALFLTRQHFGIEQPMGQWALGLMFGGIVGNVIDRLVHKHVVDFLYFHVQTRSGNEAGFPAFNVADSGICIGVGLMFLLSWQMEELKSPSAATPETPAKDSAVPTSK
ncbi:MAG: signal peptidase II [Proteobacteria bacterium]|nr:signal peptidase II [Pseudomonadota bacterium]